MAMAVVSQEGSAVMSELVIYHGDCVDGFTAAWAHRYFHDGRAQYVPAKASQRSSGCERSLVSSLVSR